MKSSTVSKPEPPPVPNGEAVTPALLADLAYWRDCASIELGYEEGNRYEELMELVSARDAFGREKYGQPLMSQDGRSGKEDALQELGDLLQYVKKLTMANELSEHGRKELCALLKTSFMVCRMLLH